MPQVTWPPRSRTGVAHFHDPALATGRLPLIVDPYRHHMTSTKFESADQLHEWMGLALAEAEAAGTEGEVPIGAVVVIDGEVVSRRHNKREATGDPTAHAEVLALRDAAAHAGTWRLSEATLVVTMEPCPMCAGAAWAARVGHVVWGAANDDAGAMGSLYNLAADPRLNHEHLVTAGVRADECSALLVDFFTERR